MSGAPGRGCAVIGARELLAAALGAASRGWRVFPLQPGGKRPTLKSWPDKACSDPVKIREWWSNGRPHNVGVVTGSPSGFFALDVDGPEGHASLKALEAEHGALPPTIVATTGRGQHRYFKPPRGRKVGSRTGVRPGLDIKADGGYVVMPPSRHPSGSFYRWEPGSDPVSVGEPADAPEWLLDLLDAPKPRAGDNGQRVGDKILTGRRNTRLTAVAGSLRRQGLGADVLEDTLQGINQRSCCPPLPPDEVATIAKSISRYPTEVAESPRSFMPSDSGNAERLVADHGKDLRYCWPWRKWLVWNGMRWVLDAEGAVLRLAKQTVRSMYREAATIADENRRTACARWALSSESAARRRSMVELAAAEEGVAITPDALDKDSMLLNVENGTIDLRTGELRPHRRGDFFTKMAPVAYDPTATCPRWERFVNEIMGDDPTMIRFLQKTLGYALTGSVEEQVMFFLSGDGANGKSTLLTVMKTILGKDYAVESMPELLLSKRGDSHPTERAHLCGRRLVSTIEIESGRRLAENLVKTLTGGDEVTARRLYEDPWSFDPTWKLFISVNDLPQIRQTNEAIWRRVRLIPFERTFKGHDADPRLSAKLLSERSGVLTWLVAGCARWQAEGLAPPDKVSVASSDYRRSNDSVMRFLAEGCVVKPGVWTPSGELFAAYRAWARGEGLAPVSQTSLGRRLAELGYHKLRRGGRRVWDSVGVLSDEGLEGCA